MTQGRERRAAADGPPSTTTTSSRPATDHSERSRDEVGVVAARAEQYVAGVRRRRAAAARVAPAASGVRDPWRVVRDDDEGDLALDRWRDAIAHLRAAGLTPVVPAGVEQAQRRRVARAGGRETW